MREKEYIIARDEDIFGELAADGIAMAEAMIRQPGKLPAIVDTVNAHLDEIVLMNTKDIAEDIACGRGCAICCYAQVHTFPDEALRIAQYLKDSLSPEDYRSAYAKVCELDNESRGLSVDDRWRLKKPCAFLGDENECTIYDVRPGVCRSEHSFDAGVCKSDYVNMDAEEVTKRRDTRPYFPLAAYRHGFSGALNKHGLEWALELTAAVRIAMEAVNPVQKWVRGKLDFSGAAVDTGSEPVFLGGE